MRTIALFLLMLIPAVSLADTIHVPGGYPTIQGGIDAAVNGDTVLVAPGTYVENIDFLGKAITVKSSGGADVTVVDGGNPVGPDLGSVITFTSSESLDSILEGFTISNGTGTYFQWKPSSWAYCGAGIFCSNSSPTIVNNIIKENRSQDYGGGIYCHNHSNPMITNNSIIANISGYHGGGIYCYKNSAPTLKNNTFVNNKAQSGGGIMCKLDSAASLINNTISRNQAIWGGGIVINICSASQIIANNIIAGNKAGGQGGGIYCCLSSPTLINNILAGNTVGGTGGGYLGGGFFCKHSSPILTNNTIIMNSADDHGGGIASSNDSTLTLINTILWANSAPEGPELRLFGPSRLSLSYSDVKGGLSSVQIDPDCVLNWGPGMINADPNFVNPTNNDFHLTFNSPCKDTGDNTAVTELFDFEGDPRIAYGSVDMGADEYHPHLYYTGNATPGERIDLKFIGIPDDTVRLWIGSGVLDPPINHPVFGDWYLEPPILLGWIMGSIPSPDGIFSVPVSIPPDYIPWDIPLQAGIGMGLSNLSVVGVEL